MIRVLARLLAVVALVVTGLVLFGAPAHACSCAMTSTAQQVAAADQVFVGTVTSADSADNPRLVVLEVEVDRVHEGDVATTMSVMTSTSSSSCGLGRVPVGARYVFLTNAGPLFARDGVGEPADLVHTGLCSGTGRATAGLVRDIERAAGPGAAPTEDSSDAAGDRSGGGRGEGSDDGVPAWPFIGGVVLVALVAGAVTARRTP